MTTNNTLILRPTISYTVQNAKDDSGNLQNDLRPYLKISDYETDKENLVSDNELTTTLTNYTTNIGLENALSNYATKTLLTESLSDKPTFSYSDSTYAKLDAANTFNGVQTITSTENSTWNKSFSTY